LLIHCLPVRWSSFQRRFRLLSLFLSISSLLVVWPVNLSFLTLVVPVNLPQARLISRVM
jgi:hypothetical protein